MSRGVLYYYEVSRIVKAPSHRKNTPSHCQGSLASQKHTLTLPRLPHIAEVYLHRENFLALRKLTYRKSSLAFHNLSCTCGRFAGHIPVNDQIKCNT